MGQIQITIAIVLTGLFAIALIGFGLNFALDNNTATLFRFLSHPQLKNSAA